MVSGAQHVSSGGRAVGSQGEADAQRGRGHPDSTTVDEPATQSPAGGAHAPQGRVGEDGGRRTSGRDAAEDGGGRCQGAPPVTSTQVTA